MNRKMQKILSIVLTLCMLLTNAPFPALAAEDGTAGASTTNGSYTDGKWNEGGNGSVTYDVDGTDVTLSKTATPVAGQENVYDITLRVETSTTTSTNTYYNAGAVVLVIDVSGSMDYCADCGNDRGDEHESDCPRNEPTETWWGGTSNSDVTSADSRMNAAKVAAANFLENYAGDDPNANRMLAIVSFQSSATTRLQWVNVAGGAGQNKYNDALSTINNLSANGGTNLDDGLYHALALLNQDAVSAISSKNVVALTDGAPTRSRTSGDGTRGSQTINNHTAAQAANVRDTGATLYTVCFGVANEYTYNGGPTVGNFLRDSVASTGKAYNADNSSELYEAFAKITESITSGLTGSDWTATDPMADMISVTSAPSNFTGSGDDYTWTLGDATEVIVEGNTTTYIYTVTYRVKLDVQGENFVEGQFFPTNGETYLNLTDGTKLAFPVPGVTGVLPRTDVSVTKVWDDAENQDAKRPGSVKVQLKDAKGNTIGQPVVLNAENNWTYTWNGDEYNLIAMSKGEYHVYVAEELDVPAGYTATYPTNEPGNFALVVKNTHEVDRDDITVKKVWNDNDDQDGIRPATITVNLLADGTVVDTAVLSADNEWTYTFTGLEVNKAGTAIDYTVVEAEVPAGYEVSVEGLVITNTHVVEKTDVSVTKAWDDADNQDGKRPEVVTFALYANGQDTGKTLTVSAPTWTGTFTDLDKYAQGEAIAYTVKELELPEGYKATITGDAENGFTVTNTRAPETTSVSGTKTWDDNNNQDGKRPASIVINLHADGEKIDSVTVTPDANGNWSWTFSNLPVYKVGAVGQKITYTISEDKVADYSTTINGYNVTNTHTPAKTSIQVQKVWDDDNNRDGIRPESVTIILLANGEPYGDPLELTATTKWTGSFTDLPEYANGQKITYTIQELEVNEYETSIDYTDSLITVTNTHEIKTVSVPVTKVWDDNGNQDGVRPESITVYLMNGDVKVAEATLDESTEWKYVFENLPMNDQGKLINYTVVEVVPEDYNAVVTGDAIVGYTITNTHAPAQTSIQVSKSWHDDNNRDGIRPDSVIVYLVINGEVSEQFVTLSSQTNWTAAFTNLPVYQAGVEQKYSVQEKAVNGYETTITLNETTGVYEISNAHNPEKIEISGSKTWNDAEDQDGKRPDSIKVHLYANGEVIKTVEVTPDAEGNWTWTFKDLYKKENGQNIVYTVGEDAVEGYSVAVNGYDITNSYTPEQTSVSVVKSWKDNNNQDGFRPNVITVQLLANGEVKQEVEITEADNWAYTFTDLDVYAKGEKIVYTVKEVGVPSTYSSVITPNESGNGFVITNTHTPETIEIHGTKVWEDNDNQDGIRPEEITVFLKVNGENVASTKATAENNWQWSFTGLAKYSNGQVIEYVVAEGEVEGYNLVGITGDILTEVTITNKHAPETISIPVTKAWVDDSDRDGVRPNDITVILLANGKQVQELKLTAATDWTGVFQDLPKFEKGKEIVYTVAELEVPGYTTEIKSDITGVTITNTHAIETVDIAGSKTWDDNKNQDGVRPESITINLLKNGEVIGSKVVTAADEWAWSFNGLPKYENQGTLINYAISETAVENYTTTVNGYNVVNTHTPEEISISVTKAWVDNNNQDGIRPNDVTIILLANGKETDKTLVLSNGNNWSDTFIGLPKYENGVEIQYTVIEAEVVGYTAAITGNQVDGYTVTNSHTPATVSFYGNKTWDDNDNQDGVRPESIVINLLGNGKLVKSITVTAADDWKWMFEDLPKFENEGTLIYYTVTENAVEGYSTTYDGFNVINVHTPEEISLTVSKAWYDNDDQDGIRPDSITVILLANGVPTGEKLVLTAEENWRGSFTGLDKFENGVEIEYTIEEVTVEGYETVIVGDMVAGYIITNSHTPEVLDVAGTKTWNDADNQDGVRPESITVNLMANGEVLQTVEVTEADGWSYSFTNLPKYENGGNEIIYTVVENAVEGYSTTYEGYNIINSYTPAEVSITVSKAWADSDDKDGLRPDDVTILLYADGELTDKTLVLTAEGNWIGSFVGLPKYANGVEIVYTVGEIAVEGYNAVIRGDAAAGFVVTNSHTVIPQTGDERTPALWMLMMLLSVAAVAYVGFDTKKKRAAK